MTTYKDKELRVKLGGIEKIIVYYSFSNGIVCLEQSDLHMTLVLTSQCPVTKRANLQVAQDGKDSCCCKPMQVRKRQ